MENKNEYCRPNGMAEYSPTATTDLQFSSSPSEGSYNMLFQQPPTIPRNQPPRIEDFHSTPLLFGSTVNVPLLGVAGNSAAGDGGHYGVQFSSSSTAIDISDRAPMASPENFFNYANPVIGNVTPENFLNVDNSFIGNAAPDFESQFLSPSTLSTEDNISGLGPMWSPENSFHDVNQFLGDKAADYATQFPCSSTPMATESNIFDPAHMATEISSNVANLPSTLWTESSIFVPPDYTSALMATEIFDIANTAAEARNEHLCFGSDDVNQFLGDTAADCATQFPCSSTPMVSFNDANPFLGNVTGDYMPLNPSGQWTENSISVSAPMATESSFNVANPFLGNTGLEARNKYTGLLSDVVNFASTPRRLGAEVNLPEREPAPRVPPHHEADIRNGRLNSPKKRGKSKHWSKDEHMLFLHGLKTCGKGDRKKISAKMVVTRRPEQVASLRRKKSSEHKLKFPSIHDITTVDPNSVARLLGDRRQRLPSLGNTGLEAKNEYTGLLSDVVNFDSARRRLGAAVNMWEREPAPRVSPHNEAEIRNGRLNSQAKRGKLITYWSKDEHMLFLHGLTTCGKGNWKNISTDIVVTRTPTQVASHAQKHYSRLEKSSEHKLKFPSIHDITTVDPDSVARLLADRRQRLPSPPSATCEPSNSGGTYLDFTAVSRFDYHHHSS